MNKIQLLLPAGNIQRDVSIEREPFLNNTTTFIGRTFLALVFVITTLIAGCADRSSNLQYADVPFVIDMLPASKPGVVGHIPIRGQLYSAAFTEDALWGVVSVPPPSRTGLLNTSRVFKIDLKTNRLIDLLHVAGFAGAMIEVGAGSVWITDGAGGRNVYRIDPSSNQLLLTIPVSFNPQGISMGEGAVWVTANEVRSKLFGVPWTLDVAIYKIDPETNKVFGSIKVPQGDIPWNMQASPMLAVGSGAVWTGDSWNGTVQRIDPRTFKIVATIEAPEPDTTSDKHHSYHLVATQKTVFLMRTMYRREYVDKNMDRFLSEKTTIWRINPLTNKFVGAPIQVDKKGPVLTFDNDTLWIGSTIEDGVTQGDMQTFRPVGKSIQVGHPVYGLAAGKGTLWAFGRGPHTTGASKWDFWLTRLAP
jgi:hypothetical protein